MHHHQIPSKQARQEFTRLTDEVAFQGERYIVTRNGRELMAMVSMEDLRLLQHLEDKQDLEAVEQAKQDARKYGTVSWDEMERRLGIDKD